MEIQFEITEERLRALPDSIEEQLGSALLRRGEWFSRKRFPGFWKTIDWLRNRPKASNETLKKRRKRAKPLAVLCLLLGIIAFVPGCVEPRNPVLLLSGAFAVCVGLLQLLCGRKAKRLPDKQAEQILEKLKTFTERSSLLVSFSETEMSLSTGRPDESAERIPYSDFECACETADLYLLAYAKGCLILPKNCLNEAAYEPFRSFLSSHTSLLNC